MGKPGSAGFRRKRSVDAVVAGLAALLTWTGAASPEELPSYTIAGDAIPASLTWAAGDPVHGRAVVLDCRLGTCPFRHTGPFAPVEFQGSLAPHLPAARSPASHRRLKLAHRDA